MSYVAPLCCCMTRIDARLQERPPLPIELELPYDSKVFFLGAPAYGVPAQVIGHDANDTLAIRVAVSTAKRFRDDLLI